MPSHSNSDLQQHIEDNKDLLEKMKQLTQQLQTAVLSSFQTDMGVPVPSAFEADVRQLEYSMVYSTDPIIDDFMSGAKTLLDGTFRGDLADVANRALDVVQTLVNKVVGKPSIQVGGHSESMRILAEKGHGVYISAAYTQVQECNAQEWATKESFYTSFYVYVVWQPPVDHLAAIAKAKPHLA